MKGFAVYESKIGFIYIEYEDELAIVVKRLKTDTVEDYGTRTHFSDSAYNELKEFFNGERKEFSFKYELRGTEFQKKVWNALCDIPYGETRSYKDVAIAIGNDKACRAVGMANNKNPISFAVP